MVGVTYPSHKGDSVWRDEDKDHGQPINKHFKFFMGSDPPSGTSFEEKYRRVALELFGPGEGDGNMDGSRAEGRSSEKKDENKRSFPFNPWTNFCSI
jgi:hypothetical protein